MSRLEVSQNLGAMQVHIIEICQFITDLIGKGVRVVRRHHDHICTYEMRKGILH